MRHVSHSSVLVCRRRSSAASLSVFPLFSSFISLFTCRSLTNHALPYERAHPSRLSLPCLGLFGGNRRRKSSCRSPAGLVVAEHAQHLYHDPSTGGGRLLPGALLFRVRPRRHFCPQAALTCPSHCPRRTRPARGGPSATSCYFSWPAPSSWRSLPQHLQRDQGQRRICSSVPSQAWGRLF